MGLNPDPQHQPCLYSHVLSGAVLGIRIRIRIGTKMSWIPNTALGRYSQQRMLSISDLADPRIFFLIRNFKSRSGCTLSIYGTSLFPF
jgi:hypothetical protein